MWANVAWKLILSSPHQPNNFTILNCFFEPELQAHAKLALAIKGTEHREGVAIRYLLFCVSLLANLDILAFIRHSAPLYKIYRRVGYEKNHRCYQTI